MQRLLALCFTLFTATTASAEPAPLVRLGFAVTGPRHMIPAAERTLSVALEETDSGDIVPAIDYRRTAARLHLRNPFIPKVAKRIGQELHLTHVVLINLDIKGGRTTGKAFTDVLLVEVETGRLLFRQRYFLPEKRLTPSLAKFIATRLSTVWKLRRGASNRDVAPEDDDATTMRSHEIDEDSKTDSRRKKPGQTASAEADDAQAADANDLTDEASVGRSYYAVGASLGRRQAILSAPGSTAVPPCYCNDDGFGTIMPGIHVSLGIFFDANTTNFGLEGDATLELATTNVVGDANKLEAVYNPAWRAEAALVYWLSGPGDTEFHFKLGYAYARFALAAGAFPGLAYSAPFAGTQVVIPLGTEWVSLLVGGAYLPFLQGGDEAASLGQASPGQSWRLSGGLRVNWTAVQLSALTAWDVYKLAFSGQTALYAPTNFANVSLTDQHLQFSINLGSRF